VLVPSPQRLLVGNLDQAAVGRYGSLLRYFSIYTYRSVTVAVRTERAVSGVEQCIGTAPGVEITAGQDDLSVGAVSRAAFARNVFNVLLRLAAKPFATLASSR
jgi:hypothetical protein